MRVLHAALAALLTFIVPSSLIGIASENKSACVQLRGSTYASATYWNYKSDKFWNSSGKKREAFNDFEKDEWILFAAYGLTRCDTLSVRGAWSRVDESLNGRLFGFEDIELGWKHCHGTKFGYLISTEIIGIIPVESQYDPGLRYGQFGGEINLLASKGIDLCGYCGSYDLRLGYRKYEGFPSDQIRADYALNLFPFKRVKVSNSLHLEYGVWNGKSRMDACLFLLSPNYRLLRYQVEATIKVFRYTSAFVGYHHHVWGRNVGTNGGFYGGAAIHF